MYILSVYSNKFVILAFFPLLQQDPVVKQFLTEQVILYKYVVINK